MINTMKNKLLILLIIFSTTPANLENVNDDGIAQEWENFKIKYNKVYENKNVELNRFKIFELNVDNIKKNNELFDKQESSFKMEINFLADLTDDEIKKYYQNNALRNETSETESLINLYVSKTRKVPLAFDWRDGGFVSEVRNQGSCGSCWAFSAAAAIEAHMKIYKKKTITVSVQNMIDCDKANLGCTGGQMTTTFNYVRKHGINSEDQYPYKIKGGYCQQLFSKNIVSSKGYYLIKQYDENAILNAVATAGPVSVAIHADNNFIYYKSGVLYSSTCRSSFMYMNHAGLIVGYGTENGLDYWIVKNSWGKDWGDNGYIKMARNKNNHCGISNLASFPAVDLPKESRGLMSILHDSLAKIIKFVVEL